MKTSRENKKKLLSNGRLFQFAVTGTLAMGLWSGVALGASEFHPRAEVSAAWVDNLTLAPDDDPSRETAYVLQVNPGFSWTEKAQRFRAKADYRMQNLFFIGDRDRDTTFHKGDVTADVELVKQYFYLNGTGTYTQELIDPKLPSNNTNFFAVNNQADALMGQLTPSLRHDFDTFHVDASYTRGLVNYKAHTGNAGNLLDARTEARVATLRSLDDSERLLSWKLRYDSQIVRYESSQQFRYDRADAELGFLVGSGLRLIGRAGKETDPTLDRSGGGLDSSTWEAGAVWTPDQRTYAEAFYGRRFYGKAYHGKISHTARRLTLELDYSESPTTQAQQLAAQPGVLDPTQLAALPDARTVSVPGAANGVPYFSRLTSDVYLRRVLHGKLGIEGQRTTINLGVTGEQHKYLNTPGGNDELRSATVDFRRALSSRAYLNFGGAASRTELVDGSRYNDIDIKAGAGRDLSQRVSVSLNAFRLRRTGTATYTANGVSLTLIGQY